MLARIRSAAILGIDAYPVDVEVDITSGLHRSSELNQVLT